MVAYGLGIGELQDAHGEAHGYGPAVIIELHGLMTGAVVEVEGILDGTTKERWYCELVELDIWKTH